MGTDGHCMYISLVLLCSFVSKISVTMKAFAVRKSQDMHLEVTGSGGRASGPGGAGPLMLVKEEVEVMG